MSALGFWNVGGALCALTLSTAAATWNVGAWSSSATQEANVDTAASGFLVDHTGTSVPLKDFRRIASSSSIADQLLRSLCEPERIIAVSAHAARDPRHGFLFTDKPRIEDLTNIESIVALKPDLLLVNTIVDARLVTRLRETGILVFDLGPMLGLETLLPNIRAVAKLVGRPTLGERVASTFRERLARVAVDIPASQRQRGIYLSVYGGHLYGGTRGTSFHDVLEAAGIEDSAAARFTGWPEFSPEQILELDPQLIVTSSGMARAICAKSEFAALSPCITQQRIVEIDSATLSDAGLGMLDAAEHLRVAVYGRR